MYPLDQMLVVYSSIIQVHFSHTNRRNDLLPYRMLVHSARKASCTVPDILCQIKNALKSFSNEKWLIQYFKSFPAVTLLCPEDLTLILGCLSWIVESEQIAKPFLNNSFKSLQFNLFYLFTFNSLTK